MKKNAITVTATMNASPEELFNALTDAATIRQWSGQKGKVQLKVGGTVELFDGWVKGVVLAFEPGKLLSHTWLPADWREGTKPSIVTYTLAKAKGGTKISLKHSGFPNHKELQGHKTGWKEFVFDPLREYFGRK